MKDEKRGKKKEIVSKEKLVSKKSTSGKKRVASKLVSETAEQVATPVETAVQQAPVQPEIGLPLEMSALIATLESPIYKRPVQLLLLALILGWVINFLFWRQSAGVNFAIAMVLGVLGGMYWLDSNGLRPARSSLWLLIPFLLFAVTTFLRQEPLTIFLAFTFALLSAGLFASSYVGGRWIRYGLLDYFHKSLLLISDLLVAPIDFFSKVGKLQEEPKTWGQRMPVFGMLRGFVIALPIVLCFGSLLASGDVVFRQKLGDFFSNFSVDKIVENVAQGILILLYAILLIGVFLHAALKSRDEKLVGEDKPVIKPILGFAESAVILMSVSLLFLAFVIIQFQYFFGGQTNIDVAGYTYSQYARRGFNELIAVAFFSLILILGLSTITKRDHDTQKKVYSSLSVALVMLVMIILVSAYQRISLAIDWHGFSRLRLYPRIFLSWLGLLLITVVVLEIIRKERYFAFAAVLASLGFAATLTVFNVDAAIVKHNVPRVLHGKNLNVPHLASLSYDAVPALAGEFNSDLYSQDVHEGIGAALTCYLNSDSLPGAYDSDWRAFNLSRWRAHNALQKVQLSLQAYGINDKGFPLRARTPSGVLYDCHYYGSAEEE